MPGGDRTGPLGRGPMTGRGAGICAGYQMPGYSNPRSLGYGQGFGFRKGRGRGSGRGYWGCGRGIWWRDIYSNPYYSKPSIDEEKSYLETAIKELEEEINSIRERIKELSKEKKENP